MEEVKQHKTDEDAWTVLRGRVYNISPYIRFHPGGLSTFANHLPCALCSLKNRGHFNQYCKKWMCKQPPGFVVKDCLVLTS